jgi:sialate O-acetylesterase
MRALKAILLSILFFSNLMAQAQIKLPRLISDGMILQRDAPVRLWGWASPGEQVTVQWNKKEYPVVTDKNSQWIIELPAHIAGGPFEMTLSASNKIILSNIFFGDVWLCSGQSNMELAMDRVKDKYPDVVASANNDAIRQFLVPDKYHFEGPLSDVESGEWVSAKPETILKFSAVAYFFALDLYAKYHVPIGLINSALGGSPAEAWISGDSIKKFPAYFLEAQRFKNNYLIDSIETRDKEISKEWYSRLNRSDVGVKNHWSQTDIADGDWPAMAVPGNWADGPLGNINGSVWFRKDITLSKSGASVPGRLVLGRIVDADSVFVNGIFAGATSYQYPPRKYDVPVNALREGKNTIVIRVINSSGTGGFVRDKPYVLILRNDSTILKGEWKYKLGARMDPLPASTSIRNKPTGLYNAMIAPLIRYPIKGVIWYQGESNTKNPTEYFDLMKTLIQDWRSKWNQGDFPFLVVQLANFLETKKDPIESNWAAVRQAQVDLLSLPRTGMAVTIDIGEWNDVHPLNKREVGRRLALQAQRVSYGEKNLVASGPLYKSMVQNDNKLMVSFSNSGSGLESIDHKELRYFSIAGSDRKFFWARAEIKKNQVIVWSDQVSNPVWLRYAWADNPAGANLCNKELLPASPFEASLKTK